MCWNRKKKIAPKSWKKNSHFKITQSTIQSNGQWIQFLKQRTNRWSFFVSKHHTPKASGGLCARTWENNYKKNLSKCKTHFPQYPLSRTFNPAWKFFLRIQSRINREIDSRSCFYKKKPTIRFFTKRKRRQKTYHGFKYYWNSHWRWSYHLYTCTQRLAKITIVQNKKNNWNCFTAARS